MGDLAFARPTVLGGTLEVCGVKIYFSSTDTEKVVTERLIEALKSNCGKNKGTKA